MLAIVIDAAFHGMGIAPIEVTTDDFNRVLAALPGDEAQRARRKFRKAWRKAARNSQGCSEKYIAQLGLGEQCPTRLQKAFRKAEVRRRVRVEAVRYLKRSR